jgi:LEA14-like dessication related protein
MNRHTLHRSLHAHPVFIWLAAIFFLSGGCAGLGKTLEPPRIQIANIELERPKSLETAMRVDLRVFNANEVPVVVRGLDCELDINDRHLASGISSYETTIPSYGTVIVPITLYASAIDMFKGILRLPQREKLTYRIKGKVLLQAGDFPSYTLPFKSEGDWTFEKLGDSLLRQ